MKTASPCDIFAHFHVKKREGTNRHNAYTYVEAFDFRSDQPDTVTALIPALNDRIAIKELPEGRYVVVCGMCVRAAHGTTDALSTLVYLGGMKIDARGHIASLVLDTDRPSLPDGRGAVLSLAAEQSAAWSADVCALAHQIEARPEASFRLDASFNTERTGLAFPAYL